MKKSRRRLRFFLHIPQIDRSGLQILQNPAGKMRESHRIPKENTGKSWNMEAVLRPEVFPMIFGRSYRKAREVVRILRQTS